MRSHSKQWDRILYMKKPTLKDFIIVFAALLICAIPVYIAHLGCSTKVFLYDCTVVEKAYKRKSRSSVVKIGNSFYPMSNGGGLRYFIKIEGKRSDNHENDKAWVHVNYDSFSEIQIGDKYDLPKSP